MRLAIIGSMSCPADDISPHLKYIPGTVVIGGARDDDTCARLYAQQHNLMLVEFLPDYDKYS